MKRHKKSTIALFWIGGILLPIMAFAVYDWYANRIAPLPVFGTLPADFAQEMVTPAVDATDFVRHDGQPMRLEACRGKIMVINFMFTRCATICPQMTRQMMKVQHAFAKDPQVQLCSFTVDPQHDTPKALQLYATRWGLDTAQWTLVTGEKKSLYRLARNGFKLVAADSGPADFIHSEKMVLLDSQMRIRGYYDATRTSSVEQLIRDIRRLKKTMTQ